MRKHKGFSLIELLIVVAIILIIAAIAVPSFLRAKMASNESAAVGALRTLNTAQISYNSAYPTVGYSDTLDKLGGATCAPPDSTSACLVDQTLSTTPYKKNGYVFTLTNVTGTPFSTYTLIAAPVLPNGSGIRYFCSFQDAVVRTNGAVVLAACDTAVPPLQ